MSLIYNATFDKNTRKLSFEDKAGNEIYSFTVPERVPVDHITKPLTFRATQDGSTVALTKFGSPTGSFLVSTDGGNTWTNYKVDSNITLNTGDEVSFRAKSDRTSAQSFQNRFYFKMTGKIEAWHNVMSLYRTNDFATYESVVESAFESLFRDCKSLTKAPALPATKLNINCYSNMFSGCQSLTKSPVLSATTLANNCYYSMFHGCGILNEVHCNMPSTISAEDVSRYTGTVSEAWLYSVSSTGTFYTNADANWPSGVSGIPTGWRRVNEVGPTVDDITKPLTFRATQDGSKVTLKKQGSPSGSFQTSIDGGSTWVNYTLGTAIDLNTGYEVSFRSYGDRTAKQNSSDYFQFMMEGKIEAWHNVMSLYSTNDFATYDTVVDYAFYRLFYNCTSLTKAPVLPATTLAQRCYWHMFNGCTSLTNAPELPATTLAMDCYNNMFPVCTSLTNAPELPATTLVSGCYAAMFRGCTSLTKAPELTSATLADVCYANMFNGCRSLNEVHCKIPSSYSSSQISSYTSGWLSGVASTGTFYTNADANWPSGAGGIPEGWTRVNEVAKDDITKPLTFRATQDGSAVKLTKVTLNTTVKLYVSFQTSRDGGNTWEDYTLGTSITLNTGDEVSFRTLSDRTTPQSNQSGEKYLRFEMTGKIEAWHNVMSLYLKSDFATYEPTTAIGNHWFYQLFGSCTSLTKAPALPATRLATSCYSTMFAGCTSLKEAPELPATTLAQGCYQNMFGGCTSLTKAPALPATRLDSRCYSNMFGGCSSLNEVRCNMPSTISAEDIPTYTGTGSNAWLRNVSSTGTFYTNADANWPSGASGIPQNWTRLNI